MLSWAPQDWPTRYTRFGSPPYCRILDSTQAMPAFTSSIMSSAVPCRQAAVAHHQPYHAVGNRRSRQGRFVAMSADLRKVAVVQAADNDPVLAESPAEQRAPSLVSNRPGTTCRPMPHA